MPTARIRAELTSALEHRQGQRVGDADQGDDHRERNHHICHRQDLIDLAGDALAELGRRLDRRIGELVGQIGDEGVDVGRRGVVDQGDAEPLRCRVDAGVGEDAGVQQVVLRSGRR